MDRDTVRRRTGELRTFMTGLVVGESPRWHDGRLWFCNWGAQEIVAADLEGKSEVVARNSARAGYSIDWLPDGRLLMTGHELTRREPDGSLIRHADLSGLSRYGWNEIVGRARVAAAGELEGAKIARGCKGRHRVLSASFLKGSLPQRNVLARQSSTSAAPDQPEALGREKLDWLTRSEEPCVADDWFANAERAVQVGAGAIAPLATPGGVLRSAR